MITSPGVSGFINRYYSVYLFFKLSAQLFEFILFYLVDNNSNRSYFLLNLSFFFKKLEINLAAVNFGIFDYKHYEFMGIRFL